VLTLALATLFFLASLLVYPFIPKTFLPNFGEKSVQVDVQLPPGSGLAATDLITQRVEQVLRDDESIESVEATVGRGGQSFSFGGDGAGGGDTARAYVAAKFADDNNDDPDEVVKRLRKAVNDVTTGEAVTTTVRLSASGGPEGGTYDLRILSDDEALLRETNDRVMAALKDEGRWEDEGYTEIPIDYLESNLTEARPVLSVDVDPRRALEKGLAPAVVALAVRQALEGQDLGEIELDRDGETDTVKAVVVYPEGMISTADMLRDYEILGPMGAVRLGDVAEVTEAPGPVQITRVDGERAALISGEIQETDTFGVIAAAQRIIDDLELSDDVEVGAGVETSTQQSGFQDLLLALPVSLLIVYIIMVVAFGSLVHPFTILFSVPFALSGALFALAITQRPLGISSLIGVMMLIGIVVTNAIVLVDLVQQLRERGMDVRGALVRGGRTRLRPILMTALATIIALIPLALGIGGGESLIAEELAIVVIGGLLVSTFLTLIIVPVVYSYLDGVSRREHPADVAAELAHESHPEEAPPPPAPPITPGPELPNTGLA
jgi:HAE1 family hydrophobic/amphiphilic exporter-1